MSAIRAELKDIVPKLDKTVTLTEKLEKRVRTMEEEIEKLSQHVITLSSQDGHGGHEDGQETPGGDISDLEVLDCSQVCESACVWS